MSDTLERLNTLISNHKTELAERDTTIEGLAGVISRQSDTIDELENKIAVMNKAMQENVR